MRRAIAFSGIDHRRPTMFFANMFCYGSDTTDVGITGIRGCMGGSGR
jgi:hypothetical protein